MNYADAEPDVLADAIADAIAADDRYEPVDAGGADRAAGVIAELL